MPTSAQLRRVEWVSYSDGEAKSKLRYMKAIRRTCEGGQDIVHWQLRPVIDVMTPDDKQRGDKMRLRSLQLRKDFISDEFELDREYPWFIESRRALTHHQRKHEADGGSTLASSDAFSEQFFCASSEGLIGLLLLWEKRLKAPKNENAMKLLEDWLNKCLIHVKIKGFKNWHPPVDPPACQIPKEHGMIRGGGYCGEVWKLLTNLQKSSNDISLDELCRLLIALHGQSHECETMKCWRNQLIKEVGVSLQQSLGRLPFVRKPPDDRILQLHMSRGTKGKSKDVDEDLYVQEDDTSGAKIPMSNKRKNTLKARTEDSFARRYLINTCTRFKGKRKFSISFGESELGRDNTLTAILSSHEEDVAAWMMPKVIPSSLVVTFHWPPLQYW